MQTFIQERSQFLVALLLLASFCLVLNFPLGYGCCVKHSPFCPYVGVCMCGFDLICNKFQRVFCTSAYKKIHNFIFCNVLISFWVKVMIDSSKWLGNFSWFCML